MTQDEDSTLRQIRERLEAATLLSTGTNEIGGMTEWYVKDVQFLLEHLRRMDHQERS